VSVPGFALLWFGDCWERLFREGERRSSGRSISSEIEAPRSSGTSASAGERVDLVRQDSSEAGRTRIEGWFFGISCRCAPSHGLLADRLCRFFGSGENENWELDFGRDFRNNTDWSVWKAASVATSADTLHSSEDEGTGVDW
jgi:hypothetical protein